MKILVAVLITVVLCWYSNRRGWYSFSEYLGCFGAGWVFGEVLNLIQ